MRKYLLSLFLTLLAGLPALATTFDVTNPDGVPIWYTTTSNPYELYVYRMPNYEKYTGEVNIPETVIYNNQAYTVTGVSDGAFFECRELTSVTFPTTIRRIGEHAFMKCKKLTSIEILGDLEIIGKQAFELCSELESIKLGDNVKSIGENAFDWTAFLMKKSNYIDNILYIGNYAIRVYTNMSKFNVRPGTVLIADQCFYYQSGKSILTEVTLPSSLLYIGNQAFDQCVNLKAINLPEGLLTIGDKGFGSCSKPTSLTLPNSVKQIGQSAFYNCAGMTTAALSTNLSCIPQGAFQSCSSLQTVIIPASVQRIEDQAFGECASLKYVTYDNDFPQTLSYTGQPFITSSIDSATLFVPSGSEARYRAAEPWSAFGTIIGGTTSYSFCELNADDKQIYYKVISEEDATVAVTCRTDDYNSYTGVINIPANVTHNDKTYTVTTIGKNAFRNCTSLTGVSIPRTVTEIEMYGFAECSALESVKLPNTLTTIGTYAFTNCYGLTSVTLPNSVTTIATRAFLNCKNLKDVFAENAEPEKMNVGTEVFALTDIANGSFYGPLNVTPQYHGSEPWSSAGFGAFRNMNFHFSIVDSEGNSVYYRYNTDGTTVSVTNRLQKDRTYAGELVLPISVNDPWGNTLGVTGIDDYGFYCCDRLTSVYIPSTITSIGTDAFSYAVGLLSLTVDIDNPDNITLTAEGPGFNMPKNHVRLYVPKDSRNRYITTSPWTYFMENLVIEIDSSVAYDFTEVNAQQMPIYYKHNSDGVNTVSVTARTDTYSTYTGNVEIPQVVFHNGVPYTVTAINDDAFSGCVGLTSVTVPEGVTNICWNAFRNCTALKEVSLPSSLLFIENYAFAGCSALTSIDLPASLKYISGHAFYTCSKLSHVTMGPDVCFIGLRAFASCPALSQVEIEVTKPSSIELGNEIFKDSGSNITLYVPKSSSERYTNSLQWRDLTIEELPYVFWEKNGDSRIYYDINDDNETLSVAARSANGNSYSGDVTVPAAVTYKDTPYRVTTVASGAFKNCPELTSVTLNESIYLIGSDAFSGCYNLVSVGLRNNITAIGERAFAGCTALTTLTLPEKVNIIRADAFTNCYSLKEIYIGTKGTMTIGNYAFSNCPALTTLIMENADPANITMGSNVFEGTAQTASLYVPRRGKADYEAADQWRDFYAICQLDVTPGDVNGDGQVSALDIVYILNYMMGSYDSNFDEESADVNADGIIDTADVSLLIQRTR